MNHGIFHPQIHDLRKTKICLNVKNRNENSKLRFNAPESLLLDEPTNNLDFSAKAELIAALKNYRGAILAVSHDRGFLDSFAADEEWILTKRGLITP